MVLRTPESCFDNLPGYNFTASYLDFRDLRMHFLSEGSGDETFLLLHGEPSWSYLYRKMIKPLANLGRVVAPDLIGFGKSDKYASVSDYTFDMHYASLIHFIEKLDLRNVTFVVQDWGGLLGLPLAMEFERRVKRLVIMNTGLTVTRRLNLQTAASVAGFLFWKSAAFMFGKKLPVGQVISAGTWPPFKLDDDIRRAYDAPYPDDSYKAGAAAFPQLVPLDHSYAGYDKMLEARDRLSRFEKPVLITFSDRDLISGSQAQILHELIPGAHRHPRITIKDAGHFLQEDKGEELAAHITEFIRATT